MSVYDRDPIQEELTKVMKAVTEEELPFKQSVTHFACRIFPGKLLIGFMTSMAGAPIVFTIQAVQGEVMGQRIASAGARSSVFGAAMDQLKPGVLD